MKTILKLISILLFIFVSLPIVFSQTNNLFDSADFPYCTGNDCSFQWWLESIKTHITDIEKEKPLSVYIQDVIVYLISFVTLLAVIYIIYAWFRAIFMSWSWNEEVFKRSMKTILNVATWIIIIWLAYSIVFFIIKLLNASSTLS